MQTNLRKHQQEGPLVITRGDGCRVYDNSGREYIESIAGLWCASLGFASERLAKVAYEQMRSLAYYHLYRHRSSEPATDLCVGSSSWAVRQSATNRSRSNIALLRQSRQSWTMKSAA